jgi:sec-independent protein translocase protein TatA
MIENLFQPVHLMLIVTVALLFFGPKKLPELGKSLGDGLRNLKDAIASKHFKDKTQSNSQ